MADTIPEGIDASSHRRSRSAVSSLSKSSGAAPSKSGSESSVVDGGAVSPGTDVQRLTEGVDFDYSGRPDLTRRRSTMTLTASRERTTRNLDDPNEMAAHVSSKVQRNFELKCSEGLKSTDRTSAMDVLAPFQSKEIVLGKLLGSGEFSHAYEIKSFTLKSVVRDAVGEGGEDGGDDADGGDGQKEHVLVSDTKSGSTADRPLTGPEVTARSNMKSRERYQETKGATYRYALKHLRPKLIDKYDTLDYAQAASDLAMEAEFLGRLVHPHIIKIR